MLISSDRKGDSTMTTRKAIMAAKAVAENHRLDCAYRCPQYTKFGFEPNDTLFIQGDIYGEVYVTFRGYGDRRHLAFRICSYETAKDFARRIEREIRGSFAI